MKNMKWKFRGFVASECPTHGYHLRLQFYDTNYQFVPYIDIPSDQNLGPEEIIDYLQGLIKVISTEIPDQHLEVIKPFNKSK
jgi:hypothetical protein